jgi:hypothetical protein
MFFLKLTIFVVFLTFCDQKKNALVQSMTDSCSYFSMWRVFDTLSSRGFAIHTLRSRRSLSMGLLRFSLFEAAKNQSFIKLEPRKTTRVGLLVLRAECTQVYDTLGLTEKR